MKTLIEALQYSIEHPDIVVQVGDESYNYGQDRINIRAGYDGKRVLITPSFYDNPSICLRVSDKVKILQTCKCGSSTVQTAGNYCSKCGTYLNSLKAVDMEEV